MVHIATKTDSGISSKVPRFQGHTLAKQDDLRSITKNWKKVWTKRNEITTLGRCVRLKLLVTQSFWILESTRWRTFVIIRIATTQVDFGGRHG